jgi:hypothetical protein
MALPPDLLGDLRDVEGLVAAVRDAVDAALAAGRGAGRALTAGDAVAGVEAATQAWLDRTAPLEQRLLAHADAEPGDAEDVAARLGGLALLHVAAAGDVGAVEALDRGDGADDVRSLAAGAGWPEHASAMQATAFDGGVVRALGEPDTDGGPDEGPDATLRAEPEGDEGPAEDVAEVVREIVQRAGEGASAVLFGLAGGVGEVLFATLSSPLTAALDLGPDAVRSAASGIAGRIAGLVGRLIARVQDVLVAVLGNYREAVGAVIEEADPASFVGEALAGKVVGRVLRADGIRAEAVARLAADPRATARRVRRMRRLVRSNGRWVGPVRFAARGLPHLWGVPLGPVPAAPVAAVALLAWAIVVTGDQLDAAGPVPDVWVGVLRIAGGET